MVQVRDPIERDDVIKLVNRCKDRLQGKGLTYEIMLDMVQNIPSADRPQGEWIDTGKDPDHSHPLTAIWYRCSECGDGTNTKTNYCPNCGCRMKGADDEADNN